jgi:hypothetical protein
MFIVPLLIILFACVKGFEAKRLWKVLENNIALSRFAAGCLFAIMAIVI